MMQKADDIDARVGDAVEGQMLADHETEIPAPYCVARSAQPRRLPKKTKPLRRIAHIALGQLPPLSPRRVAPNLRKVRLGAR